MKTLLFIITTFYTGLVTTPNIIPTNLTQNCSAELSVIKNRNFESADYNDGTSFTVLLKNTSSQTTTYTLSTNNLSKPCSNSLNKNINNDKNKMSDSNVELDVSILTHNLDDSDKNKNIKASNSEIKIAGGQEYKFKIVVSVPEETPFNSWSCIEVKARSNNCNLNSVNTILSVFVSDPSEG